MHAYEIRIFCSQNQESERAFIRGAVHGMADVYFFICNLGIQIVSVLFHFLAIVQDREREMETGYYMLNIRFESGHELLAKLFWDSHFYSGAYLNNFFSGLCRGLYRAYLFLESGVCMSA